jgi:hypothetical protein
MGLLYGRAGRLTAQNDGFRRGQSANLSPREENGTFSLYSNANDFRLVFWRNNTTPQAIDLGDDGKLHDATLVDWWNMKLAPMKLAPMTGKITLTPPHSDAVIQLIKRP